MILSEIILPKRRYYAHYVEDKVYYCILRQF